MGFGLTTSFELWSHVSHTARPLSSTQRCIFDSWLRSHRLVVASPQEVVRLHVAVMQKLLALRYVRRDSLRE